jgi:hypothetical protein
MFVNCVGEMSGVAWGEVHTKVCWIYLAVKSRLFAV